jgi:predicted DNA-binding protein with PD1-like motif
MDYVQGAVGRVFVARLEDGESIYEAVEEIAQKEGVQSAAVLALGGMRRGKVVTGPESPTGRIVPHYEEFDDAREVVGLGTLFPAEGRPSLHFHAGIGRGDSALVGSPRAGMSVFLVLEVVIIEITGLTAERALDEASGLHLLRLAGGQAATPMESVEELE